MYPNQCQSKSNCSHIVRQCCACHHLSCQISHFHFLFRVCHDVWLPHHQLLMRHLPSWSLSELFCSTSWSVAVYLSSSTHLLLLAVLQQWSLIPLFGWFDTSHYYCQVQNLQSKVHVEESTYWFVKTRVICWSTVVKAIPSYGGDHQHQQVQELHALMTSSISDFGCIIFMFMF